MGCMRSTALAATARSSCIAMQASEKPFKDYWTSTVYPIIKDDYERLLKTTPNRIATKLR